MENRDEIIPVCLDNVDNQSPLVFTQQEELNCYKIVYKHLIKLLYLIEEEQKGGESVQNWFTTFMLDLLSSNSLCKSKLVRVVVKMNSLYEKGAYKSMTHTQIKRQIMESRGIVDHLITELENEITSNSDKK